MYELKADLERMYKAGADGNLVRVENPAQQEQIQKGEHPSL